MSNNLLDQVLNQLVPTKVGIEEFAESDRYCNPPDAPVWMADLHFKPIGDVQIGDQVVGWQREESGKRWTTASTVLDVKRRQASLAKVTMASGRTFRCTPDHLWLTASFGGRQRHNGEWFCPPAMGRKLVHIVDVPENLEPSLARRAAWLGGLFDGEGSVAAKGGTITIAQSEQHNPEICREIERVLNDLGLNWTRTDRAYRLGIAKGGRTVGCDAATSQMLVNFVDWCPSIKGIKIAERLMHKRLWRTADEVVSVEPDGEGEVVALTTSTGNYVCNGYASKNCNKVLYPAQTVLLKLIFLEELTGPEEDILDWWIQGGRNGTEITLSPDIRGRVDWLRDHDYPHFREVDLVGGRRSSKGFCTGIAMAKVMWDVLQLQDPGAHFGIDPEKNIDFSCIAVSEEQAKDRQYADFSSAVETCRAFEPYLVKSLETEIRIATESDLGRIAREKGKGGRIQKDIARLRGKALAANAGSLRGAAIMAACVDEMAHMIPGESKSAADQIYNALEPSMDQFGEWALVFCNSSPYTEVGMFFERFQAALRPFDPTRSETDSFLEDVESDIHVEDLNGNPRIFVLQFPSWAMFEGYQKSKNAKKIKSVLVASPEWDIDEKDEDGEDYWSERDKAYIRAARAAEAENPETYKVERRGKFASVTDAYMSPTKVDLMFSGIPTEWVYETDGPVDDAGMPIPRLVLTPFNTNRGGGVIGQHKFHLDPSSTTAGFGFAIAHTEFLEDYKKVPEEHVVFDLVKRWEAKNFPGKVIRWDPILKEIIHWAELFRPFEITFDQHESVQAIQELSEALQMKNMSTRVYMQKSTAEFNWKRYEVTKTAIYSGLVHAPYDTEDCKYAAQELKFLQIKSGIGKFPRIDRQEIGPVQTKDMADCIADCVHTLIGNQIMNRTRERLANTALVGGSPGGYGFMVGANPPVSSAAPIGAEAYYKHAEERAAARYSNPARGVVGGGRGRRGHNRARW